MSSSLDHKCQRCGSQYHGQICPFCTITGLDVNALLASEGLTMPSQSEPAVQETALATLVDVVSNRVYPVNPPVCRFGRDISNDIVLTGDKSLSRFHFQLTVSGGDYLVEDAGSRNGTFLNGSPVTAPRKVLNGDIISAGMSRYRLVVAGEEAAPGTNGDGAKVNGSEPEPELAVDKTLSSAVDSAFDSVISLPTEEVSKPGAAEADALNVYDLSDVDSSVDQPALKPEPAAEPAAEAAPEPAPTPAPEPVTALEPAADLTPAPEPTADVTTPEPGLNELSNLDETPRSETTELKKPRIPVGNKPETDAPYSSIENLFPGKEEELGDTASRFLKLAQNERLWPEGTPEPEPSQKGKNKKKGAPGRDWPQWCTDFTFGELDELRGKVKTIETEIAAKQTELDQLNVTLQDAEGLKNRLLATRDTEMVEACSAVFRGIGWETKLNPGTNNELVLSSDGTAVALVKIVCSEGQPKPNEFSTLVSSLSNYWSENGVEPKGILLVAFVQDGPLQDRPELSKDLADYAAKKNLCLMNSLQLLAIYREAALRFADVESIKSALLAASGLLGGFDLTAQ